MLPRAGYRAAEAELKRAGFSGDISGSPVYTMSDDRFHSHRKEQAEAGRNLSFIAFPKRREAQRAVT